MPASSRTIGFESDDYHVMQGFIAAGLGVTLLPDLALPTLRSDLVVRADRSAGARRAASGPRPGPRAPARPRPRRCSRFSVEVGERLRPPRSAERLKLVA